MNVLDLFSGIGGFSLGLERSGMNTIAFVEQNEFCQKILAKHWPDVPIYDDITTITGVEIETHTKSTVDVIAGGWPCQPFSTSGERRGAEDDRHLWPEMLRLVQELEPSWVVGENVAGIIDMELDNVLSDLEALGYATGAFVIPACAVGAPHQRDRVWVLAHSQRIGQPRQGQHGDAFDTEKNPFEEASGLVDAFQEEALPYLCRRHDGLSQKLDQDRLTALGNAVVPQVVEVIGNLIMDVEQSYTCNHEGSQS